MFTASILAVLCGLCSFIGSHKYFHATLKIWQKNNIWSWSRSHQQTPSSLIYYTAYSVMQLTKGFHAHKPAWLSTVNHSLCWRWWESRCVSGAVHLAEVSEACLQRKKTNPDPLPHERLPASQPAASRRLSSRSGPLDQDVWVWKWLCCSLSPFL